MYHIFFIHSSVDWRLGCFYVLTIVYVAAVNIGVHVSFRIMVFSDSEIPTSNAITYMWNLKKKDRMNFFAEKILTHRFWKTYGFQMGQVGGWGDALRVWHGNAIKLGCDDHCTIINVIKFIE